MSYSVTYNAIKTQIVNLTQDESDDLSTNLDTIIALAETCCLRDLDLEIFQQEITGNNLTAHNRIFARPSGVIKINGLWLSAVGGTSWTFIPRRTLGYCNVYAPDTAVEAFPAYFADRDETDLYFVNTPAAAYPSRIYGIERPAGLSNGNQTTWLSNYAGDLLLKRCLIEAEVFLTNTDQIPLWKDEYYNDVLPKAKIELRGLSRASYESARAVGTASSPL